MADGLVIYAKARAFKARAKKNWPSGQDQGLPSLEHIRSIGVSVCVCVSAMCVLAHR